MRERTKSWAYRIIAFIIIFIVGIFPESELF